MFKKPKVEPLPTPVDPADTANRLNNQRGKRLAGGGRNATFLSAALQDIDPRTRPTATLTGIG